MTINFSDEDVIRSNNSIFLAGPTSRTLPYDSSWRKEAVAILENMGFDGIVYIPEYGHGKFDQSKLEAQAIWERIALESAGCIVFWIPRSLKDDMPAFTTNVEFGTYLQRKPKNISFGYPEGADKMWYLEWLYHYEVPDGVVYHTLQDTLEMAIKLSKKACPIGLFYMDSNDRDYQVTAYDKFNDCYLSRSVCDDIPTYYQRLRGDSDILTATEVINKLNKIIADAQSNYDIWNDIYVRIGTENMRNLLDLVEDLSMLRLNIKNVRFLAEYNPNLYNPHIIRTEKGYRRKLKRVYRILGEDDYNKFIPLIEATNYVKPSYWKWKIKNANLRIKWMQEFLEKKKQS